MNTEQSSGTMASCPWCGCTYANPSALPFHMCAAMQKVCSACRRGEHKKCHPWTGLFGPENRDCECFVCGGSSS